jgi:hypothetical protein
MEFKVITDKIYYWDKSEMQNLSLLGFSFDKINNQYRISDNYGSININSMNEFKKFIDLYGNISIIGNDIVILDSNKNN